MFTQIWTQMSNRYKNFIKYKVKEEWHAHREQFHDVILCNVLLMFQFW